MASTLSSNMSLPIPTVGSQPGPDYAFNINASLTLIDQHDHSQGRGVQITPAGLNINTDLTLNDHSLTTISNLVFSTQVSSALPQALYVAPGTETPAINDLFFNDGNGNIVQITSAGAVNATAASIPGESYAGGTFFWKQGTGSTTPANFDIGSITLRPNTALTTNGVRLSPPSTISTQYDIAFPELPAATNILSMDVSGNMFALINVDNASLQLVSNVLAIKNLGVTTAKIDNLAVTEPKMADNSVSTRTIIDGAVTRAKLASDVILPTVMTFDRVVPSFAVRVASTTNLTLTGHLTVDGVVTVDGDLVLAKNQTSTGQNGVYVVAAGAWTRSTSYNTAGQINYAIVSVTSGTVNANTSWGQNNIITTINTDAQSWSLSSTVAWVVPTGVTLVNVLMVGGGGGGSGEHTSGLAFNGAGSSGGAGSLPQTFILSVTPGETLNITVGGGGRGGTVNGVSAAFDGSFSSIRRGASLTLFTLPGGTKGNINTGSGSNFGAGVVSVESIISGTTTGSGNGGSVTSAGSQGVSSIYAVGGAGGGVGTGGTTGGGGGGGGAGLEAGGAGATSVNSGSGATPTAASNGGIGAGGGGGAGSSAGSGGAGGNGGNGRIVISYF